MSELYEFVKKRTSKFSGVTCRKLYGLDALYLSDKPFVVISTENHIVIKVDDFEVKKNIEKHQVTKWILNGKVMENWFVLPETFNKKKNKLTPVIEMTSKALLSPKKEKIKRKKKVKTKKSDVESKLPTKKPSLLKRLMSKLGAH